MRHSNRRGHTPYNPNKNYPQPSRARDFREGNRFMNESDDYYGSNRYQTDAYSRDTSFDQEEDRYDQRDEYNARFNDLYDIDQRRRFADRDDRQNQYGDRFESDRYMPRRENRGFQQSGVRYASNEYKDAWPTPGPSVDYRGIGPKGYKRAEGRIKEDVNDRLSDDYLLDASNLEVEINSDEVILKGTVTNRNSKRRAEDIVESVSGVKHIENRIRVDQNSRDSSRSYSKSNGSTSKKAKSEQES